MDWRPCESGPAGDPCERWEPGPYTAAACWICWLYHTNSTYRDLWNGPKPAPPSGTYGPTPPLAAHPRGPCVHLGDPTGARQQCYGCAGHVEIKLLACAAHGHCTTYKQLDGVACCQTCPDHRPRTA